MTIDTRTDDHFEALLVYLERTRNVDFRGYKRTSLRRRIEKRLKDLDIPNFGAYQDYLEVHPLEFQHLLDTVLINVSAFFRDKKTWEALNDLVLSQLVEQKKETIRIWCVGCASGEEPYTVAILLAELLGSHHMKEKVKIYATDLDEEVLQIARQASYQLKDVKALSPDWLKKYFVAHGNQYTVCRDLRKVVIFGEHNVISDPPISKIDLLICRNLLIYLNNDTQKKVLKRLHYSLNEPGYLFLGKAETLLTHSKLFKAISLQNRVFQKSPYKSILQTAQFETTGTHSEGNEELNRLLTNVHENNQIAQIVINQAGILISANHQARKWFGLSSTDLNSRFQDLDISYRPIELRGKIEEVKNSLSSLYIENYEWIQPSGQSIYLNVEICPIKLGDKVQAISIYFNDVTEVNELKIKLEHSNRKLLEATNKLQSANEELETTNEELQSTNEELETTNEELQSTNEELETSNEELQASNEELEQLNSELKKRADDLNNYHNFQESLLSSMHLGIVVLDKDNKVMLWNQWNERVWGLKADHVMGNSIYSLAFGLPHEKLKQPIRDVLLGDVKTLSIEISGKDLNADPLFYWVTFCRLSDNHKMIRGVILIIEDITEFKRNKESLKRSEQRYEILASTSPVGIMHADADGLCLYVNQRWCDMTGLTAEASQGTGWIRALHSEDREAVFSEWSDCIRQHKPYQAEMRLLYSPGKALWVFMQTALELDEENNVSGLVCTVTDITQRRFLEKQLQQHQEDLYHISRLHTINEMVTGFAHELNQPLMAISGHITGLIEHLPKTKANDRWLEALIKCEKQIQRASKIIQWLRNFVKKDSPERKWININYLIKNLIKHLEYEFHSYSASVLLRLDPSIPSVFINALEMEQVLINLIINALHAIAEITSLERRVITIGTHWLEENRVGIYVKDLGVGMTEEAQKQLFIPFYTTKEKGMGMGLCICQNIIQSYGGELSVSSILEEGTEFEIKLPVSDKYIHKDKHNYEHLMHEK